MIEVKLFEVRDRGTFIPVIATVLLPEGKAQADWLMRRAGFTDNVGTVLLTDLNGGRPARTDPYDWRDRTFTIAHEYIERRWSELNSGDLVDVEYILGETGAPKTSERPFITEDAS